MNADLHAEVLRELAEFRFKDKGTFLRGGECPNCHKKELFTHAERPWVVRCGRLNKCGYEAHVKDLYPHLFEDWSQRTAAQRATNPDAAADAYMQHARGFDLARIKGWYRQESHYHSDADNGRGAGTATVRFAVGTGYWERLIDRPARFNKKANFQYGMKYHGTWWCPPTLDLLQVHRLWLVEGIFDAIALDHHATPAAALLSCNNYPEAALAELRKARAAAGVTTELVLVWALDGDNAGRTYTRKWVERARADGWTCEAAQVPQRGRGKTDWNDLHLRERLQPEHLREYLHHGALLVARSATEKGLLIYRHADGQAAAFAFDFDQCLYWFSLNLEAFQKALDELRKEDRAGIDEEAMREAALKQAHTCRRIANCLPTPLYFQENKLTDESWYYWRVEFPHDAPTVKNTFTASQLSAASEFKKRLLAVAPGAVYSGTSSMLERILERQLYAIQRVETVDFIGYSREHGAYIFGDVAVKDGRQVGINAEDFFEFGKLSLKSLNQSVHLAINADASEYSPDWARLVWRAFGAKGLVAAAFWLGALFAEQIRATQKSFPFLEIVGEPGAGKSTLIEFLWKLFGRRDYEGFDPSKSSLAARARNFAQVANLPVVLIESDRERLSSDKVGPHVKSFDWDELKTAYNGRSVRARGMATGGNETYEPPFRGAIVISQNNEVSASDAILQRICHLGFDRSTQNARTREAAVALEQMPIEQVSGFILRAVQREADILQVVAERTPLHEQRLMRVVKSTRLAKNHAQIAALAEALCLVAPIDDDQHEALQAQIEAMAVERQQAINADHPVVEEFWDVFEYLDHGPAPLNHSRRPADEVAVNLNHFLELAREHNQQVPPLADLKKTLKTSKRYRYREQCVVNSALRAQNPVHSSTTIWCWVFDRTEGRAR